MKYFKVYFLLNALLLLGCNENAQRQQPKEDELTYANEHEKLLNEAFLEIVGTDLCYRIDEKYLSMAQKLSDEEGEELGRKIFDKYKIEDTSKVVVFTKDKFLSRNDWHNKLSDTISLESLKQSRKSTSDGETLDTSYLPYIKQHLVDNQFIRKNGSFSHILDSLSKPLKISSFNLKQTSCFKIVRLKDREEIKGRFRTIGTFNCSRIYIDQANRKACLFYEKNCLGGTKCATGALVILKKQGNKWKVLKEVSIYVT
ncbi:MAG: hypothetical protein ACO1O1_17555 [Adhaeribacter sp.]